MEQYTTTCGVVLPEVDGAKNYPLVFYTVSEEWEEFLRCASPNTLIFQYPLADHHEAFLKKVAQAACTMYSTRGIGIAANQVGFKENWCIIDTKWTETGEKKPRVILNPNLDLSLLIETEQTSHEGCLSVPMGFRGDVPRHSAVQIVYTNLKGEEETWDAFDLDAAAVMHELDHLRGKLFIDYISNLRRSFLDNKLKKVQKRVKHQIRNHNKQIIAQVKKLNKMAVYGYRPKTEEPLAVEEVLPRPIQEENICTTPIDEMPLDQF